MSLQNKGFAAPDSTTKTKQQRGKYTMRNRKPVRTDGQQEGYGERTRGWTSVLDLGLPEDESIARSETKRVANAGTRFISMP